MIRSLPQYTPFRPRVITALPAVDVDGFHLKRYAVAPAGSAFDETRFSGAVDGLTASLPQVDIARGCPGAGFLILHQGVTGDYAILSWWDRENELPTHVWIRQGQVWAPARDAESFCVWDLELIWFERNAWIETVLSGMSLDDGLARYRRHIFPGTLR